jgi:hypothetical protein
MIINFISGFIQSFYSPKSLYGKISKGRHYNSWLCVLIYCLVYVLGSLWLYFKGFTPFVGTWIKLSETNYYLIQSFYIIPLVFLMWILCTGVVHVLSKFFGGSGKFDTMFTMTGYSLWAPLYLLIIVDCLHSTPEWLYNIVLGVCMILMLNGTVVATMIEEKISLIGAIISSIIAFTSIGLILFTYIR